MTGPRPIAPPRTTELLLEALGADTGFRDDLVGDLAEEFAARAERSGAAAARRWYRREALRAVPHLLVHRARRVRSRDLRYLAGVALSAYVLTAALGWTVAGLAYGAALAFDAPRSLPSAINPADPRLLFIALSAGVVSATTAGYLAAWLGRRAPLVCALALGVAWSCLLLAALFVPVLLGARTPVPLWYRLTIPLVVVACTTLGGVQRVRRQAPRVRAG